MNCRYCDTALPDDALFCGECGRAVLVNQERLAGAPRAVMAPAAHSPRPQRASFAAADVAADDADLDRDWDEDDELDSAPAAGFSIADLAFSSPGDVLSPNQDLPEAPDGPVLSGEEPISAGCPQCGARMVDGDVFCGECGFVLRVPANGPPSELSGSHSSPATSIILLPDLIQVEAPTADEAPPLEGGFDAAIDVDGDHVRSAQESDPTTEVEPVARAEADLDGRDAVEEQEAAVRTPAPFALPIAQPTQATRSRPIPDPFPWGAHPVLPDDIEATRLVADTASGTRFVLQFSTGESVTVVGSGLIGRNPAAQPGEYVDQLVPIFDAGKSVSKSHLEFGQESGRFWVSDRYSTNGSVIRQPESPARRCDPGRRYFVARGTRVDLGEQFFVVS